MEKMNLYNQEELDRIQKEKDKNDKLEELFNDKRVEWNKLVEPLFKVLTVDLSNPTNSGQIMEVQSLALSYRQQINENINFFLNKRSKETVRIKKIRQDKLVFYAIGFPVKTNGGQQSTLIDAHLGENDRCIELIESYIEYLRDTVKNLESISYAIKNKIELMNYLGR
jgi:hypothetical protein